MTKAVNHATIVANNKSDKPIAPKKLPNKAELSVAKAMKENGLSKKNNQ